MSFDSSNRREPARWLSELHKAHRTSASLAQISRHRGTPKGDFELISKRYPVCVTPYYAQLIDADDPADPIAKMVLPDVRELQTNTSLASDPLQELARSPVERLLQRYPDRAVIIATTHCAAYCRHCTRKQLAGRGGGAISPVHLEAIIAYLRDHPEIRDVIVSGGDPLTLEDHIIEPILAALREVETVHILRVATRTPVVLPMRITTSLVDMLRRHQPCYVSTQFNHPRELTVEARRACAKLIDAGVPVVNQCVLISGVNDDPAVMAELCLGLVETRVRPYYVFISDLTEGVEHLRAPLSSGIELMKALRGTISGLAIPTLVVDTPAGKIPVLPETILAVEEGRIHLRGPGGSVFVYPDPAPMSDASDISVPGPT